MSAVCQDVRILGVRDELQVGIFSIGFPGNQTLSITHDIIQEVLWCVTNLHSQQNQLQYNWMVDLDNAASVMVLPSKSGERPQIIHFPDFPSPSLNSSCFNHLPSSESLSVDVSCSERTSALVTASAVTDIKVDYKFYYRELGDTMVEFDTVDAGEI